MMSQKNKDFLNAGDPSSLGQRPEPTKPEPFVRQPIGYKTPDGTFIETAKPIPAKKD